MSWIEQRAQFEALILSEKWICTHLGSSWPTLIDYNLDYYSGNSGYSYFAGRDGSHSFFTGDFTEEGVKNEKSLLEYDVKSIKAIEQWREFYETHETYTYVGLLQGKYYDAEGEKTPYLQSIMAMISSDEL